MRTGVGRNVFCKNAEVLKTIKSRIKTKVKEKKAYGGFKNDEGRGNRRNALRSWKQAKIRRFPNRVVLLFEFIERKKTTCLQKIMKNMTTKILAIFVVFALLLHFNT